MGDSTVQLPVFLPGNNRDWVMVDGVATITEEGEINVKLHDPEKAQQLVEMFKERILLQISFDYRMADEVLEKILSQNRRFKKEN